MAEVEIGRSRNWSKLAEVESTTTCCSSFFPDLVGLARDPSLHSTSSSPHSLPPPPTPVPPVFPQIPSSPLLSPKSSGTSRFFLQHTHFLFVSLRPRPFPVFAFWIFQMLPPCRIFSGAACSRCVTTAIVSAAARNRCCSFGHGLRQAMCMVTPRGNASFSHWG